MTLRNLVGHHQATDAMNALSTCTVKLKEKERETKTIHPSTTSVVLLL